MTITLMALRVSIAPVAFGHAGEVNGEVQDRGRIEPAGQHIGQKLGDIGAHRRNAALQGDVLEEHSAAKSICRPGCRVGFVGVPHHSAAMDFSRMFFQNIALQGGVAPVRAYIPELLADVLAGRLDPSPVLDLTVNLAGVPEGYRAMDTRKAIKVMVMV